MAKPSMATWVGRIKIGWNYTILTKIVGRRGIPDAVRISKPWSFSNLQQELPFITRDMSMRKSRLLVGLIRSIFRHLWT